MQMRSALNRCTVMVLSGTALVCVGLLTSWGASYRASFRGPVARGGGCQGPPRMHADREVQGASCMGDPACGCGTRDLLALWGACRAS